MGNKSKRKRKRTRDQVRLPVPPAGCLIARQFDGDENTDPIEAPEYRAMATKGIRLAGKITFAQYECLVENGYAGEVVMRWTQHHAAQEIERRKLVRRRVTPPRSGQDAGAPTRTGARRPGPTWPVCPVCGAKVRDADRLDHHVARVHGRPASTASGRPKSSPALPAPAAPAQRNVPSASDRTDAVSPDKIGPGQYWDARL